MVAKKAAAAEGAVRLRVVSDAQYVVGIPAEVGHEFEVDPATAAAHMETGLFEVVSGTPAEQPSSEADEAAGGSE